MARLHEYQGKAILRQAGLRTPRGGVARTAEEAASIARGLGGEVVIKAQAWTTSRAAQGGVAFCRGESEAAAHATRMLGITFGQFPVTEVLVEERLEIARELFLSLAIDEKARTPILILSGTGGSGVESRAEGAHRITCDVHRGPASQQLHAAVESLSLAPAQAEAVREITGRLFNLARSIDARSLEINPLAITRDGAIVAADCRLTIDDYAVHRHPELGIEIARELDHPPTPLERLAYQIEQADHRGTFFFAQMATAAAQGSRGLIGFHGAGGGGSMMAMDAVSAEGFTVANFCDTSGNPSVAKVYHAAKVILSQPGIVGYFGSGSGVASQEQFWSAYGLAKAFWEVELSIPAVIRLGGNTEDRAVEILRGACGGLPAAVEGYRKNDPPAVIAARFAQLVQTCAPAPWNPRPPRRPTFAGDARASACFAIKRGRVWISLTAWRADPLGIMSQASGLLRDENGSPQLTVSPQELEAKDNELIACEVECRMRRIGGPEGAVFVELDVPTLPAAPQANGGPR